ncbi:hypothetical protein Pan189_03360 [Stratiformator vulcanicus]|uniref:Uncharacterized protein n=1 Tax=Stratiformator vulcanicus TaxID=2527980 RepID=A0A517QWH0_9PLAN|nr:hypothetical protein Pan189_03360 [Stratiformator vulcanicus]
MYLFRMCETGSRNRHLRNAIEHRYWYLPTTLGFLLRHFQ